MGTLKGGLMRETTVRPKAEDDPCFQALEESTRSAVNTVCRDIGYEDIMDLVTQTGYENIGEFLDDFNFTSLADFFFGLGWYERVYPFKRKK